MLLLVVGSAALGGLILAFVGMSSRVHAEHSLAIPLFGVVLLMGASLLMGLPIYQQVRLESRLDMVARALAERNDVRVSCQTPAQAWLSPRLLRGYVGLNANGVPERTAVITPETCDSLKAWLRAGEETPSWGQVIAVHVLTHESMHLKGIRAEDKAECAALQRSRITAQLLGASSAQATELARSYLTEVYPTLPTDYRNSQCRRGGSLDEQLTSSPWT